MLGLTFVRIIIQALILQTFVWQTCITDDNQYHATSVTFDDLSEDINHERRGIRVLPNPTLGLLMTTKTPPYFVQGRAGSNNSNVIYIITSLSPSTTNIPSTAITDYTTDVTTMNVTSSVTNGLSYFSTAAILNYTSSNFTTIQQTTVVTSATSTTTSPGYCMNSTYMILPNSTCAARYHVQLSSIEILNSNSTNSADKADALSLYIGAVTNSSEPSNLNTTLTLVQIEEIVGGLYNANYSVNTNDSILFLTMPQGHINNKTIIGASFKRSVGGTLIDNVNRDRVIGSIFSAAGIVTIESLADVRAFNMLIISDPSPFQNADSSGENKIASSIIVTTARGNNTNNIKMEIELYFQKLVQVDKSKTGSLKCAFYDRINLRWNTSGCSSAAFSEQFNRFECVCSRLGALTLIWLPNIPLERYLDAQDIASLFFQLISIFCFILIVSHTATKQILKRSIKITPYELLPLISFVSSSILFTFYIALGMTVYTRTSSADETQCFLSSSVLMFFVYFFLIFMFCTKTSVAFFNYLRFVRLFPPPKQQILFRLLSISFVISILCVAFAIGFNSNSSYKITQLYPYKLCWFTRDVIYYFLTIPICLFILINFIIIVLIGKSIKGYVQNSSTLEELRRRLKVSVTVLLLSCVTQGLGWLFGPFISFVNLEAGQVFGWLFIVFNGLEGLWSLILYISIWWTSMQNRRKIASNESPIVLREQTSQKYEVRDGSDYSDDIENEEHDDYRNAFN